MWQFFIPLFSLSTYDDNPRKENPSKIREDIKKGIKNVKIRELPDRKKAICEAINNLNTGELLLVAGKGHEKTQDYGKKKLFCIYL